MKKILRINKADNFTVYLLGHNVFEFCNHKLISFSKTDFNTVIDNKRVYKKLIDNTNVDICKRAPYSFSNIKNYINTQSDNLNGLIYYLKDTDKPVGCLWIMYKNGDELQYRIRNIDAFGFYFCVFDEYKGKGLINDMIQDAVDFLSEKGIDRLYASVRKNNLSALKAYKKVGYRFEKNKRFCTLLKIRIPYPKI